MDQPTSPSALFEQRLQQAQSLASALQRQSNQVAAGRMAVFLLFMVAFVYSANERWAFIMAIELVVFVAIFGLLVRLHRTIKEKLAFQRALAAINHDELLRARWKHAELPRSGAEFLDRKHPYTYDLDVFGKGSLYQWLNRAVSESGRATLARWLSERARLSDIEERQEAIKEVSPRWNWRQAFEAEGRLAEGQELSALSLSEWISEPPVLSTKRWLPWLSVLLPLHFFVHAGLAALLPIYPVGFAVLALLINLGFVGRYNARFSKIIEDTSAALPFFRVYAALAKQLLAQPFQSAFFLKKQAMLTETRAITAISELNHLLTLLDFRLNALFAFTVNAVFLLDLRWMLRLEKWKAAHSQHLSEWIKHMAEVEALNSLAGMWFAQPEFSLPTVTDQPFRLQARAIGHPLIPAERRVCNDFSMEGNGQLVILSGSNMAGKSTFLRTLAVNTVLALAGGPVCARHLHVSSAQVFTSMRIEDSLDAGLSSFYAELTRLQQLFLLLREREDVFFLLDEMLRGTNSEDRQRGVMAILLRLLQTKASGFISTHDLALAELAKEKAEQVRNFSFESSIEAGKIRFDYRLQEGICRSFNAFELMKEMGLLH